MSFSQENGLSRFQNCCSYKMMVSYKPTNVVEKFAIAYSRASSQGDGHCTVSFSRHESTVSCMGHEDYIRIVILSILLTLVFITTVALIRSICFCHK